MKILESIEKEVDELTEQACRKWLKKYKQAMFLIHAKLYHKNSYMVEYFNATGRDVERTKELNILIEAKAEISIEIAKVMNEYNVTYAKDILEICNSEAENIKQWKEYFGDRGLEKHAKTIQKIIEGG